ncbi:MAG: FAD-dependent oxidoreductase, partial [Verrucomicrobiota bacterium]
LAMKSSSNTHRRSFLQAATGLALTGTAHISLGATAETSSPGEVIRNDVDVLVVGGGTAGTIAAIQAGRAGARTMVLERHSQLGGMTTTGGVSFPGLFDAWGKQIIAGIGWELVKECVELDQGTLPDFSRIPKRHWHNQVVVNPFLYVLLAEEKCDEAGVAIAYHEFPTSVHAVAGGWEVDCVGFGTQRKVTCKQIIDCTGGAEVVGMLGLARLREDETQPGSQLYQLDRPDNPGRSNLSRLYVHGADSSNSRTVTQASLVGRMEVLKKVRDSNKRLTFLQQEPGFRESYRIVGETLISVDDYTAGRKFDDAICNAFYPVDLHTKTGVKPKPLKKGTVPTIPLGALIPKGSRNIMVAGRSLSSDRLANSGLRVQAPCMAMGQAAAATATLAVQQGRSPGEVPLKDIYALLLKHGALLP